MYKRLITYKDFDGETRSEEFYFNLSRAEILHMNFTSEMDFQKYLQRMIDEKDTRKLYDLFEEVINMSVGKKSVDGRRFHKSQEIRDDFKETDAYSELLVWLLSDADNASEFIRAVLPEKVASGDTNEIENNESVTADVSIK